MRELKTVLAQHFLLRDLSPRDLERVGELATTRWYQPNQPVFMKGDPGSAMMAVLSGRVRICAYSADGREVVLNVINPGEIHTGQATDETG